MKREKLIFVVVVMMCSFAVGTVFAQYELQEPDWCVVDSGLNDTIGTGDYADGLDTGDSVGYRLDCSIGGVGIDTNTVTAVLESPTGETILEPGFYLYYSTWIANPTFVFEVTTTTIKFQLESHIDPELEINPSRTQYAIAFSSGVTLGSLFESATFYIKRGAVLGTFSIVDYFDDADEYWNTASFYEEIKLTGLNPNTIYGFKIKGKLPPEIDPTDWSGDTDNPTWTHIETPDITVEVYITTATVTAGSFSNLGAGQSRINFSTGSWTGWIADDSYTFTGLDPNTSYTFQVQARNGEMYPTEVDSMDKYTLCAPPENPYITDVSSTSLTLVWEAPWVGIVNYYRIEEKDAGLIQDKYKQLSLDIDNLSPNTSYTYTIYAVNESSDTHPMSSVSISTYTKCSIPPAPQIVDVSSDTISIIIDPGDNPSHTEYSIRVYSVIESTRYVYYDHTPVDYDEVFQTTTDWGDPLTITNLGSNVWYDISVQARNYYGVVDGYGDSVSTHTPCVAPGLQFEDVKEDSASFIIMEGNNSPETEYAIFVEQEVGGMWPDIGYLTDGAHIGDVAADKTWHTKKEWDELYGEPDILEVALNLKENTYRFHIYTRDSLDNEIEWPEYFYLYKITESWIEVNFPVGGRLLGGLVNIQWISSQVVEEVDIYYSNDGGASFDKIVSTDSVFGVTNSYLWDTTTDLDGNYIIKIEDQTGPGVVESGEFTIDNTPPRFTSTSVSPNPAKDGTTLDIEFTLEEENFDINQLTAEVILSTEPLTQDITIPPFIKSGSSYIFSDASCPVQESPLYQGGEKQIHFYAEDLVGNTANYYFPVVFDFEAPTVTNSSLEVFVSSITISVEASDDDFWQDISTTVAVNYINYTYICEENREDSGGIKDNSYSFENLSPNKLYTLNVNLTDAAENERVPAISTSTYTLCATPGPPSIEEVYASSMTVKINLGSNPPETRFSLAISFSAVTYYVKPDGSFDLSVTTATYSDLGGDTGITITGLNPATEYTLKCRAMNNSGRPTDWSTTASSSTLCGPIGITAFKMPAADEYYSEWTNVIDFKFVLTGASSYYYILRDVPDIPASYPNDINGNEVDISINSDIWYVHFKGVNPTGTDETKGYYEVKVDTTLPELDIDSIKAEIHGEVLDPEVEHSARKPIFTWDAASDSFSGVNGYSISFSTNIGDGPNYDIDTTTNSIEREPEPLDQDATYYFKVKAIDNAGNSSQVGEFVYKYKADLVFPWVKSIDVENKKRIGNEVKGVERKNTLPEITFTEKVWYVEDYVEVELIRDNEGKDISGNVSCAINDEGKKLWKIDPGPGEDWESNHTYKIKVSTGIENEGIKDEADNSLKEGKELIFTTMLDHTKRNVIMWESDPETKMILEANALKEDGYILINLEPLPLEKTGGAIEAKQVNPEAIIEADEKMKRSGDRYCYNLRESMKETSGYTTEGGEMVIDKFLNSVYIELPYADENNNGEGDGIVDSTEGSSAPVSVKTLSVYWLDEEHRLWVKVAGTEVDKEEKVARAKVMGFGVYTLMGGGFYDLSDAYAYPVPYKPNDGLSTTGDKTSGITFINLSTEAEIKIYTITGELVKKLIHKDGWDEEWYPVENEKGEKVVSGVYIYYIENQKQHKSGKLMIIR